MQVAQRVGVPRAVDALVQPHGPATHPVGRATDPLRRLTDRLFVEAGDLGDSGWRVIGQKSRHVLPAFGVRGDERRVGRAVGVQQVQQTVEQRQVGARLDLQEQVGLVGSGVAPWVDDDQSGASLEAIEQAQEQDWMTVGHVRADHQKHLGLIEIIVRAGRAIGTQRQLVATAGAGHAQPRIGFDMPRAHVALGKLVDQVLGFQRHLPGDVEGQGIGAMLIEDLPQAAAGCGDGGIHVRLYRLVATVLAQVGVLHAPRIAERLGAGAALGAQASGVGRMLFVAADLDHAVVLDSHDDTAADAAVGAHATH